MLLFWTGPGGVWSRTWFGFGVRYIGRNGLNCAHHYKYSTGLGQLKSICTFNMNTTKTYCVSIESVRALQTDGHSIEADIFKPYIHKSISVSPLLFFRFLFILLFSAPDSFIFPASTFTSSYVDIVSNSKYLKMGKKTVMKIKARW